MFFPFELVFPSWDLSHVYLFLLVAYGSKNTISRIWWSQSNMTLAFFSTSSSTKKWSHITNTLCWCDASVICIYICVCVICDLKWFGLFDLNEFLIKMYTLGGCEWYWGIQRFVVLFIVWFFFNIYIYI